MKQCVYCGAEVPSVLDHYAKSLDSEHPEFVTYQARAELRAPIATSCCRRNHIDRGEDPVAYHAPPTDP